MRPVGGALARMEVQMGNGVLCQTTRKVYHNSTNFVYQRSAV